MTAHDPKLKAAGEVAACVDFLWDSIARRRISDAWLLGTIDGDTAMTLLLDLDLIEVAIDD